jgi:integrase
MLCFINIGLNTGLRVSDLLELKFEDLNDNRILRIIEIKTQKIKLIKFNTICVNSFEILKKYYMKKGIPAEEFLFKSLNREFIKKRIFKKISYSGIKKYFTLLKNELKLEYPIGTHSLRKTFGKRIYENESDLGLVMKLLNHSSEGVTLRYIGIDDELIIKCYDNLII